MPECWVVDVTGRAVERFAPHGRAAFRTRTTSALPEHLAPAALDLAPLDLAGLFRGL